jgi:hypothetical protein
MNASRQLSFTSTIHEVRRFLEAGAEAVDQLGGEGLDRLAITQSSPSLR